MTMTISDKGIALIKELEGVRSHAYLDSGKAWTIGVGHLLNKSERASGKVWIAGKPVKYSAGLADHDVVLLLKSDLAKTERDVNRLVSVPLAQHQFDALVSFAFNIGSGALAASTLRRVLNAGQYDSVPAQMRRWVHDNGVRVQGLANRREREVALWEGRS
jgi:lysozyme